MAIGLFLLLMMALMWRSTRRQLENAVPPALRRSEFCPGRFMRFLIMCSGTHSHDLAPLGAGRHAAHAIAGALIFIPTAMAFLGLRLWLGEFLPDQPAAQMIWAATGATLVFLVDLGCVWSLSGLHGKNIIFGVLPRAALAVVLGYFITKPFVVMVYKDEIAQMQRDKKKSEVLDVASRMREERKVFSAQHQPVIARFKAAKDEVQRRLEALQPRRVEVQARHDELHRKYIREVTEGQNGRPDGRGKYAEFLEQQLGNVKAELDTVDREESALKAELERLAKDEEAAVNQVLNDPKFAETQAAFDTVMREAHQSKANSIGRQLDLVRAYVAAGDAARKREYTLWHLLFWFLDTIPITVKLAMRRRDVHMLQGMQEKRVEASVLAETASIGDFAEKKARAQHEAEIRRLEVQALIDDLELLYQAAMHAVLRGFQYEIEAKKIYAQMAKKMPKDGGARTADMNRALSPLSNIRDRMLKKLHSIIEGYGSRTGNRDDDGPPSNMGLN